MRTRRGLTLLLALLILAGACNEKSEAPFAAFGKSTITLAGTRSLSMVVANTDALRQRGLSNITELSGYDGMLFAFPEDTDTQFWMKDTKLALDIAFVTADGTVLSTEAMPLCPTNDNTCPRYGPGAPYRYALEAPSGAFAKWELKAGSHVQIP